MPFKIGLPENVLNAVHRNFVFQTNHGRKLLHFCNRKRRKVHGSIPKATPHPKTLQRPFKTMVPKIWRSAVNRNFIIFENHGHRLHNFGGRKRRNAHGSNSRAKTLPQSFKIKTLKKSWSAAKHNFIISADLGRRSRLRRHEQSTQTRRRKLTAKMVPQPMV